MTAPGAGGPLVVALMLDHPDLAERVASLLADVPGIRLALSGEQPDAALVMPPPEREPENGTALTPREHEVIELLALGSSNKEIARKLGISVHTAKFHVGQLLDKLDATGRTDAVAHAARLGVILL